MHLAARRHAQDHGDSHLRLRLAPVFERDARCALRFEKDSWQDVELLTVVRFGVGRSKIDVLRVLTDRLL